MKKLLVVVLSVAMVVSIAACSKKNKDVEYVTDANGEVVTDANGEPVTKSADNKSGTTKEGDVIVTNEDGLEIITISPEEDDISDSTTASGKGDSQTTTTQQSSTKASDSTKETTNAAGGSGKYETPIIPLN